MYTTTCFGRLNEFTRRNAPILLARRIAALETALADGVYRGNEETVRRQMLLDLQEQRRLLAEGKL